MLIPDRFYSDILLKLIKKFSNKKFAIRKFIYPDRCLKIAIGFKIILKMEDNKEIAVEELMNVFKSKKDLYKRLTIFFAITNWI